MRWKRWLLPLVSLVMFLINGGQLLVKLTQPEHGPLIGQGLMSLFWLALAILSFRGFSASKKKDGDEAGPKR